MPAGWRFGAEYSALILRAISIALVAALLSLFSFTFLLFGLLPIFTAVPGARGNGTPRTRLSP